MNKIKELLKKYKEVIMYLIFGVLSTIVNIGCHFIFTNTIFNPDNPIELTITIILSWIITIIFVYFTNRKYVFESSETNKIKEFTKFTTARITTLVMELLIMYISVTLLHFNDKIMKIVSQFVVIVSNYIFSKLFVFKKEK